MQTPEPQQRDRTSAATTAPAPAQPVAPDGGPATAGGGDALAAPVEVAVHADPALIPSVRAVAADLAARADFDLDAVSDLRMAVDEACSALVPLATPGSRLRCGFTVAGGSIEAVCRVDVADGTTLRQDTFGWRVLTTLTDAAEVLEDGAVGRLGVRLRKDRLSP